MTAEVSWIHRSARIKGAGGDGNREAAGAKTLTLLLALSLLFAFTIPARAHLNNKDVFEQVSAGPYKLFVTIRTPLVIPGVATVEVRSSGAPIQSLDITPIPLTGEAARHPPAADPMRPSSDDPAFYTGSLWLMASGSWQVRLQMDGPAGSATVGVPVAAVPRSILPMQHSLGLVLAVLGFILLIGAAGIVAAAVREARLAPGLEPTPTRSRRAVLAAAVTFVALIVAVALGNKWWNVEAADYAKQVYKPSDLRTALSGNVLNLQIGEFNEAKHRWSANSTDDFLLDHGHLMHLYAIRMPGMDAVFHLHPEPIPGSGGDHDILLRTPLPTTPPGTYSLYADVVHRSGFPETLTASLVIPSGLPPSALSPEDASAAPPPLASGELGPSYKLPDGYTMVWDRPATIVAETGTAFRFTLLDPKGQPASDMEPYLGMAGHAAFVRSDGGTFAHTHPEGSAAMPAVMLANQSAMPMPGLDEHAEAATLSPTVEFPYGFPTPGRYRIFVQMKHAGTVETGVFDAQVVQ